MVMERSVDCKLLTIGGPHDPLEVFFISIYLTNRPYLCSFQPSEHQHQQNLTLAEFALHLLKTSGKLWTNGCMEVTTVLSTCTLDDLRAGMNRVTSR